MSIEKSQQSPISCHRANTIQASPVTGAELSAAHSPPGDQRQSTSGWALALAAVAVGVLAIGALAIGRLAIGRARIRRLEIDELVVRRLRVTE